MVCNAPLHSRRITVGERILFGEVMGATLQYTSLLKQRPNSSQEQAVAIGQLRELQVQLVLGRLQDECGEDEIYEMPDSEFMTLYGRTLGAICTAVNVEKFSDQMDEQALDPTRQGDG